MATMAQNQYLTDEVMTATPQKLHLLLIEGAIRLAERARQLRQDADEENASKALVQAQRIVMEIIVDIKHDKARDLTTKVAAIYWFIYRSLVDANILRDETKLDDAVRVLRCEQETWRQVCQKLGTSSEAFQAGSVDLSQQESDSPQQHQSDSAQQMPPAPSAWPSAARSRMGYSSMSSGGLSFEA